MIVLFHSVILRFHANFHLFPTLFDSKNHHTCRNIEGPNIIVKCRRPSEQRPSHYNKKHVLSGPPCVPPGVQGKAAKSTGHNGETKRSSSLSPHFQRRCFAQFPKHTFRKKTANQALLQHPPYQANVGAQIERGSEVFSFVDAWM